MSCIRGFKQKKGEASLGSFSSKAQVVGLSRLGPSLGSSSPMNKEPFRERQRLKEKLEEALGSLRGSALLLWLS